MKKTGKQNNIDSSEDTTVPNPEVESCKPVSVSDNSGQIKKIAKNKPGLVSAEEPDSTPLNISYSQGFSSVNKPARFG